MPKKTKRSSCVHLKKEDECTLPCKPVRDSKTRKFLHCRTAITLANLKKIIEGNRSTKRKYKKKIAKAMNMEKKVKKMKKDVEKEEKKTNTYVSNLTSSVGETLSSMGESLGFSSKKSAKPTPKEIPEVKVEEPKIEEPKIEEPQVEPEESENIADAETVVESNIEVEDTSTDAATDPESNPM